jgi:hypothetical protein
MLRSSAICKEEQYKVSLPAMGMLSYQQTGVVRRLVEVWHFM